MTAKQVTNVVFAMLPCRDDVEQALALMKTFGEVAGLNVWPEAEGVLEVAYYDVRAAERALEQLGDMRCWRAPPCGNRIVRLPGSAGLDRTVVDLIRDMFVDETDSDYYILEFFDVRDAAQHRQLVEPETDEQLQDEWNDSNPLKGELPMQRRDPEMSKMPAKWWQPWQEDGGTMMSIAEEEEVNPGTFMAGTFLVMLQGIPQELLNKNCVDAILEQAGLAEDVGKCTIHQDKVSNRGYCLMTVLSEPGVYRCLTHFAGCCWGAKATLVHGELTMCYGQNSSCDGGASDEVEADRAEAEWPKMENGAFGGDAWTFDEASSAALVSRPAPATMPKEAQPTSEASTDLSESDDEMLKLQGRHLLLPPPTAS
mmetsp:Transcript_39736/g.91874  ORF Transcript_39736/g.91874 Transcript_39736/m.91874 type:complete len:369 (+) Transcript_39736:118-1224(+)